MTSINYVPFRLLHLLCFVVNCIYKHLCFYSFCICIFVLFFYLFTIVLTVQINVNISEKNVDDFLDEGIESVRKPKENDHRMK